MAGSITLTIALYGAFREYGASPVTLEMPAGCGIAEIQKALAATLHADAALVENSVLADAETILPADARFAVDSTLAILPPVCGG